MIRATSLLVASLLTLPAAGTLLAPAARADPDPLAEARGFVGAVEPLLDQAPRTAAGVAGAVLAAGGGAASEAAGADLEKPARTLGSGASGVTNATARAKDALLEASVRLKDEAWRDAIVVKDNVAQGATALKDDGVRAATGAKDAALVAGVSSKDAAWNATVTTKDSLWRAAVDAKNALWFGLVHAKDEAWAGAMEGTQAAWHAEGGVEASTWAVVNAGRHVAAAAMAPGEALAGQKLRETAGAHARPCRGFGDWSVAGSGCLPLHLEYLLGGDYAAQARANGTAPGGASNETDGPLSPEDVTFGLTLVDTDGNAKSHKAAFGTRIGLNYKMKDGRSSADVALYEDVDGATVLRVTRHGLLSGVRIDVGSDAFSYEAWGSGNLREVQPDSVTLRFSSADVDGSRRLFLEGVQIPGGPRGDQARVAVELSSKPTRLVFRVVPDTARPADAYVAEVGSIRRGAEAIPGSVALRFTVGLTFAGGDDGAGGVAGDVAIEFAKEDVTVNMPLKLTWPGASQPLVVAGLPASLRGDVHFSARDGDARASGKLVLSDLVQKAYLPLDGGTATLEKVVSLDSFSFEKSGGEIEITARLPQASKAASLVFTTADGGEVRVTDFPVGVKVHLALGAGGTPGAIDYWEAPNPGDPTSLGATFEVENAFGVTSARVTGVLDLHVVPAPELEDMVLEADLEFGSHVTLNYAGTIDLEADQVRRMRVVEGALSLEFHTSPQTLACMGNVLKLDGKINGARLESSGGHLCQMTMKPGNGNAGNAMLQVRSVKTSAGGNYHFTATLDHESCSRVTLIGSISWDSEDAYTAVANMDSDAGWWKLPCHPWEKSQELSLAGARAWAYVSGGTHLIFFSVEVP